MSYIDINIHEQPRNQVELFFSIDDRIGTNSIVRLIDSVITYLIKKDPIAYRIRGLESVGRPAYTAETLLKIYVYGCMNRITSSRRLEAETYRNIEMMWLTGNLNPDHKTISDFRKDHNDIIKKFNLDVKKMLKDFLLSDSA